jgi:PAS domain S-box-containing protein
MEMMKAKLLRILIPLSAIIILFFMSVFLVIMPTLKDSLVEKETSSIKHLVESKIQILDSFNKQVEQETLTLSNAKKLALKILEDQRYGENSEFYFFITDLNPVLLMHPFQKDLTEKFVGDYSDSEGKFIFTEMVEIVDDLGEGYLEYLWQLPYSEDLIIEKKSFVKLYEPWGWIIGTGFYLDQLSSEINSLFLMITILSLIVLIIVIIISIYIIKQRIALSRQNVFYARSFIESEQRYKNLIDRMNDGFVLVDTNRIIQLVNQKFCEMVGKSHQEVIHKSIIHFINEDERANFDSNIRLRTEGIYDTYETELIGENDRIITAIVSPMGLFNDNAELQGSFAVYTDISALKETQKALIKSISEKEMLIKEIHHRVKNNLQIIISLLNFQKKKDNSDEVNELIRDSESRIFSMALVHELLFESPRLDSVNMKNYLVRLVENLFVVFQIDTRRLNIYIDFIEMKSSLEKVTLVGLIISELFFMFYNNLLAAASTDNTHLNISSVVTNGMYSIFFEVKEIMIPETVSTDDCLGLNLIKALTQQLGAEFNIRESSSRDGQVYKYILSIPLIELAIVNRQKKEQF